MIVLGDDSQVDRKDGRPTGCIQWQKVWLVCGNMESLYEQEDSRVASCMRKCVKWMGYPLHENGKSRGQKDLRRWHVDGNVEN